MPIYEYRCEKCGVFEQTQRITAPALDRCPTCRRKVRRLISNTSFQLKGGGWYVTDYARAGKESNAGKDGGKDGGETKADKGESTSDTASAKAEAKSDKAETKTKKSPTKAAAADA
jgi:putative FmdB family regulatory protein